jgi:hypothetical protein
MSLLLKDNAVFLHIPKTGGIWIGHVLRKLGLVERNIGRPHCTYDRVFWHDRFHRDGKVFRNILRRQLGLVPPVRADAFKFCFVREPLSWYVSWWRYMEGKDWCSPGDPVNPYHWSPLSALTGLGSHDFNTFVYNVNRKRPGFVTELFGNYVKPGIAFVGRQERLRQDFLKVASILHLPISAEVLEQFPPINESRHDVPVPEWDPELRQETFRLEYAGYLRYGYAQPGAEAPPEETERKESRSLILPAIGGSGLPKVT